MTDTKRTYTPDTWVLLEFNSKEYGSIRKVLAGWSGGYTTGDSWKLSSGVEDVEDHGDHYKFKNSSGSIYICWKGAERLTAYTASILHGFEKSLQGGPKASVTVVKELSVD